MGSSTRACVGLVGALAVAATLAIPSCASSDPCSAFRPKSQPVAIGESAAVTLRIANGAYADLDFGGALWSTRAKIPDGMGGEEAVPAIATQTSSDQVEVRIQTQPESVWFDGPIGCM